MDLKENIEKKIQDVYNEFPNLSSSITATIMAELLLNQRKLEQRVKDLENSEGVRKTIATPTTIGRR